MAREQTNSPCLCQPRGHIGEIRAHLLAGRSFVVPRVLTALVDAIPTKRERAHPVIRRRRMQAHEGIRIQPMTPRTPASVDHRHLDVGFGDKRVDEGKTARASPYDQIIGTDEQLSPSPFLSCKP